MSEFSSLPLPPSDGRMAFSDTPVDNMFPSKVFDVVRTEDIDHCPIKPLPMCIYPLLVLLHHTSIIAELPCYGAHQSSDGPFKPAR